MILPPTVQVHRDAFPKVTPDTFGALLQSIQQDAGREWYRDVAWQPNLWEAREQAAASGKPIFIWSMNGHPLGCT